MSKQVLKDRLALETFSCDFLEHAIPQEFISTTETRTASEEPAVIGPFVSVNAPLRRCRIDERKVRKNVRSG